MIDPRCEGESMPKRFLRASETAEKMNLQVELAAAVDRLGMVGCYDARHRAIYLSPNVHCLGEMVFILWHELGHAALDHAGAQSPERERDADRWAARNMFSEAELHRITTSSEDVHHLSRAFLVRDHQIERVQAACAPTPTEEALAS